MTKEFKDARVVFRTKSREKELMEELSEKVDMTLTSLVKGIVMGTEDVDNKFISYIIKTIIVKNKDLSIRQVLINYNDILHPFFYVWIEKELIHRIDTGFEIQVSYYIDKGIVYFSPLN